MNSCFLKIKGKDPTVGSKKTPSPGAVPGCTKYPVTTQPGEKGSIIVNVNTSHSIEKYPEDNTSD
jgi:hypothetical protein